MSSHLISGNGDVAVPDSIRIVETGSTGPAAAREWRGAIRDKIVASYS